MINKLVLTDTTAFEEAVAMLDRNGNGFLPIVDQNNKLQGIITDGDIRRAILKNLRDIRKIMNTTPVVASAGESRTAIVKRLYELKRRHMPLVDEHGHYIDVITLNDFNEKRYDNVIVIMAGGLGTRLGELTRDTPKPMLKVKDKPILHHIIDNFKQAGFHRFILCLNYKSEVIQNYFGDGQAFGVSAEYTIENKRLGTAGALSLLDKSKLDQPFFVTNADIITQLNFENVLDLHNKSSATATLCVKQHTMQLPYANVMSDEDGNLISLEEKPSVPFYINAGIYVLNPSVLSAIPFNDYLDMPSLLLELKAQGERVKTFRMEDYWIDIGLPHDYIKVNNDIV